MVVRPVLLLFAAQIRFLHHARDRAGQNFPFLQPFYHDGRSDLQGTRAKSTTDHRTEFQTQFGIRTYLSRGTDIEFGKIVLKFHRLDKVKYRIVLQQRSR